MYKQIIKPLLFRLNAELAHDITMTALSVWRRIPGSGFLTRLCCCKDSPELGRDLFGLHFKNPVGLAAGLDKNGEHYNDLANFGFGFVEIGSLTPQPQQGNSKPRLFRLPQDRSFINRMGINNKGVRNAAKQLRNNPPRGIVAANIAKNSTSVNEDAVKDYETAFSLLYDFVDMFVLNVSCPNVEGLANLQDVSFLSDIADKLISLRMYFDEYRPI
ncbi:MAG: quinone-dependent dihydroorotate dehydrogenase, partial [Bacteroidales bacterium]|nr:quinone-dependent dihydroorotate dehydrogenase [Bacteroidales bacterium]